jgi:hypothetical protein
MSVHAYPARALWGDYLRALAGTVPCLVILAAVPLAPLAAAVAGGLAAVFTAFGLRTGLRHRTHIEMSDRALCASGPRGAQIPWAALDGMKLSYYALRRDGEGWMQLVLRAGPAKFSLDSRIEGFALIVERAARAAASRHLPLSSATLANLEALDLMPAEPPAAALWAAGEQT